MKMTALRTPGSKAWILLLLLTASSLALAFADELLPVPPTPKKPVINIYHGVKVEDDYQWLENWDDPTVRAWSDVENNRARAFLRALPGRQQIRDRLKSLYEKTSASYYGLLYRSGTVFAIKLQPPKQQPFLVAFDQDIDSESESVVTDPNVIDPSGKTAIDFYAPSVDGRFVALSMSEGGSENGTVHVYDARSGQPLSDLIPRVNKGTGGGSLSWNLDGSGFYYTRYPSPSERPAADLDFFQQVYFHKLGTPVDTDAYSLGKDFPRIAETQLQTSIDGRYVLATVANGDGGQFEHFLLGPDAKWKQITQFSDGITQAVFGKDSALYLISQHDSPRGSILRLPLDHPALPDARPIVPPAEDMIEQVAVGAHSLYVVGNWGGPSDIRVFDLEGHDQGKIPIESVSAVYGIIALDGNKVLYENESFVGPPAWFRFDSVSGKSTRTSLSQTSPVDFSNVEVVREYAPSKDGTKVPMSIMRPKGTRLDGKNPTQLTAYGGFGINLAPSFDFTARLWLDQGGVLVIANLRGGREYGDDWHKSGMLTHKQNVFDDFAACAEYLIRTGYTSRSKLAIQGASNGGLLMGAALTQHPNLFRAVVSGVGIYDMLRNELSSNAVYNVTEYGSVKDPDQFKALYAYSPYHHVTDGTAYPAILFFTGANDPRVNPMQSRKMVARLQAATSSGLPILLRTSSDSGHIDASLNEQIELGADFFAFLFNELGMTVQPAPAH
jgi:prolyl oligopeptidase